MLIRLRRGQSAPNDRLPSSETRLQQEAYLCAQQKEIHLTPEKLFLTSPSPQQEVWILRPDRKPIVSKTTLKKMTNFSVSSITS